MPNPREIQMMPARKTIKAIWLRYLTALLSMSFIVLLLLSMRNLIMGIIPSADYYAAYAFVMLVLGVILGITKIMFGNFGFRFSDT